MANPVPQSRVRSLTDLGAGGAFAALPHLRRARHCEIFPPDSGIITAARFGDRNRSFVHIP